MRQGDKIMVTLTLQQAEAIRLACNFALSGHPDYFDRREMAAIHRGLEKFIRAEGYEPAIEHGRVGYRIHSATNAAGRTFSER